MIGSHIYIICSDQARNGKTLFARLYTDFLSLSGFDSVHLFDTDYPNGGLSRYFPDNSEIVDLSKTAGQVRLFDTMIENPDRHYVVDLQSELLDRFFKIFHDISFDSGAAESGLDITVFFILDRSMSSIHAADRLRGRLGDSSLVLVQNGAVGSILHLPSAASEYSEIEKDRDIVLPKFSDTARNYVEDPNFSFARFIAGGYRDAPIDIRQEVWSFLESLYEQRDSGGEGTTHLI